MAPRAPKPKASTPALDEISSIASASPLKPKASKVEKPKTDKPKITKAKVEKALKAENDGAPAPPAPAPCFDETSSIASPTASPLKPKASKVEKTKTEKPKVGKAKVEKDGEKAVKKEKKDTGAGVGGGKRDAGKEKVKAVTGDEAERMIVAYLKEQNRPYSATEVSANLHGKVTKTNTDKLLKELEQSGAIMGKASNGEKKAGDKKGGQWVFWCLQDPADRATPEELATMDTLITTLRESTIPPLKSQLKGLSSKLSSVLSAPTTADLHILVANLQASNAEKRERVQGFKDNGVKMVSKEAAEKVERERRYWEVKRRARKECFLGVEGIFLEGMKKEELWEKAGIEDGDVDL